MRRILVAALLAALVLVPSAYPKVATAQSGNTWTGFYYGNLDWAGAPVFTQSSQLVSFNWGYGSPSPNVPVDNFTATYKTSAYFYAGTYRFTLTADDEITLIVGGISYLDTRGQGQSGKTFTADVTIPTSGMQDVIVYYREFTQLAYAYVDWQLLKGDSGGGAPPPPPTPAPPNQCSPQSATNVKTEFGDYTPCIQQGEHQSACFQSNGQWNAPNMGSIETEPHIEIWGNCQPDSVTSFQVSCDPDVPLKSYKCSKTGAGWFPN